MRTEYPYRLGSNKFPKPNCPYCGAKKHWQRYYDIRTGEPLPEEYGKCDNADKCGQWNDPYKMGYAQMIREQERGIKINPTRRTTNHRPKLDNGIKLKPDPVFMPPEILRGTLKGYDENVFIQNLCSRVPFPFEASDVEKVISLYRLGTVTSGYLTGATTFPYIDAKGNIRTIQVRLYDEDNHGAGGNFIHSMIEKRHTREKEPLPAWLKSYNKNEKKVSCLFGEHLLSRYPKNPVAIAEGPKQAIYGTLYFGLPDNPNTPVWLATFNVSSLNAEICRPLAGRNVTLYPDLSIGGKTYRNWCEKAKEIQKRVPGLVIQVSDLLERLATNEERKSGNDLADYLVNHDWRAYRELLTKSNSPHVSKDQTPPKTPDRVQSQPQHFETILENHENSSPQKAKGITFYNIPEKQTKAETMPFIDFPDDEKQNDGHREITPMTPINSTQSHQKQFTATRPARTMEAFTNDRNELLIQNPMDRNRFTVYPNIESYNRRSVLPESRPRNEVTPDQLAPVRIDPVSLTCSNGFHS